MDRYTERTMMRVFVWIGAVAVAICYAAYQANPMLAIACAVGIAAFAGLGWAVAKHKENQVKKMVEDVEAGADRFVRGDDQT